MFEVMLIDEPMKAGREIRIGLFSKMDTADLYRIVLERLLSPRVRIFVRPRSSVYMLEAMPPDVGLSELGAELLARFSERVASEPQTPSA
jgi:hypothetical protein